MAIVIIVLTALFIAYMVSAKNCSKCVEKEQIAPTKFDIPKAETKRDINLAEYEVFFIKNGKKQKGVMKEMPQGLQVFDAKGRCVLDLTTKIAKVVGIAELDGYQGEIKNPLIEGHDVWMAVSRAYRDSSKNIDISPIYEIDGCSPYFKVKGDTIYWEMEIPYFLQSEHFNYTKYLSKEEAKEFWTGYFKQFKFNLIYGVY